MWDVSPGHGLIWDPTPIYTPGAKVVALDALRGRGRLIFRTAFGGWDGGGGGNFRRIRRDRTARTVTVERK